MVAGRLTVAGKRAGEGGKEGGENTNVTLRAGGVYTHWPAGGA